MPNQPPNYTMPFSPDPTSPDVPTTAVNTVPELQPPFPINIPQLAPGQQWTAAGINVAYMTDLGLRGAPVAGPFKTPIAIWRLHGGLTYKVVTWAFEVLNGIPPFPSPLTCDNEVLVASIQGVPSNGVQGDQTLMRVRTGQYVYLLQYCLSPDDPLYGAVIPVDTSSISQNYISPGDALMNLIGPIPNPSGFSGGRIGY